MENKNDKQQVKLKTVDIKGKQYVQVNERVRVFRIDEQFAGYKMITIPIVVDNDVAFFEARIIDREGNVVANGHARELQTSSFINKISHVENAETSAIGRALGSLGIGIESSYCTGDEVLLREEKEKNMTTPQAKTFQEERDAKQKRDNSISVIKNFLSNTSKNKTKEEKLALLKSLTGQDNWVDVEKMNDEGLTKILGTIYDIEETTRG